MLLDDVASYLATSSVGVVGTTIWKGQMPDTIEGLVLNEYPGAAPAFTLDDTGVHYELPRFQVLCRHSNYGTGRALIEAAYVALNKVVNQTLTATKYMRIEAIQTPFQMVPPQDAQGRWLWGCNFQAMKALG